MKRKIILSLFLCACAPGLGSQISPPAIPELENARKIDENFSDLPKIRIGEFVDSRSDTALAVISGREVLADSSLGPVVQEGFERMFRDAGGQVALFRAPMLTGEIQAWQVKVSSAFPTSQATATAKIRINLQDQDNRSLYRGTYTGESTIQHPFLSESKIRDMLGQAMAQAIQQAIVDEDLLIQLDRTPR